MRHNHRGLNHSLSFIPALICAASLSVGTSTLAFQEGLLPPLKPATVTGQQEVSGATFQSPPASPQGQLNSNELRTTTVVGDSGQTSVNPPARIGDQERPAAASMLPPQHSPANETPILRDSEVRPTNFNQQSTTTLPNRFYAERLLEELKVNPADLPPDSQLMGLQDMLVHSAIDRRNEVIRQYWSTWQAWAEYRFSMDQLRAIQQMGPVRTESDRLTLEAAQSLASDNLTAHGLELSRQQHLLNQLISGTPSDILPLPSDQPLIAGYETQYEIYASKQTMPEQLRMIDQWLPGQFRLVGDRAATVHRCRNAVLQNTRGVRAGQPVTSALETLRLARTSQTEFVDSVVTYNQSITDYAMTVRPNVHAAERIVAMLIPVMPDSDLPLQRGNQIDDFNQPVRQAALPESAYGSGVPANRGGIATPGFNSTTGNRGGFNASPSTALPANNSGQAPIVIPEQFRPTQAPDRSQSGGVFRR